MKPRAPIFLVSIIVCLTAVAGIFVQHRQIKSLRADQQRPSALAPPDDNQASETANHNENSTLSRSGPSPELLELLRLRSQAGRLADRKRELTSVRAEYEQLRAQVAARGTNISTLPPGYVRENEAQWVGQNTPENAMQSYLWAVKNRDAASLQRLLSPEANESFPKSGRSSMPGFRIVGKESLPDGGVELKIEVLPGGGVGSVLLRQFAGEWKLDVK
jgi:hypothetical protein